MRKKRKEKKIMPLQIAPLDRPLASTVRAFKALLETDSNLSPSCRPRYVQWFRDGNIAAAMPQAAAPDPGPRVLRRKQVAEKLSCSLRTVDKLPVKKVKLPGRKRAAGFLESDINSLLAP